jgi:hypothetical protein
MQSGSFGYGRGYWNTLVFRFVPAQFVGKETKEAMQFTHDYGTGDTLQHSSEIPPGTTSMGLGDSFEEFGYFGCVFFAGLAILFRSLWNAATVQKSVLAQLYYILNIVPAMRALTHQTADFLPALIYNIIFMTPVLWYTARRRGEPR